MFSFTELRSDIEVSLENKTIIEIGNDFVVYEDLLISGCIICTGCVENPATGGWICESCGPGPCPK